MGMDERTDVTAKTNSAPQGEVTDQAEVAQREKEEQPRLAPDKFDRRDRLVLLGTVLLSLAIFLLDCLTTVGYSVRPLSVWPLYLIPLMLTARAREKRYPPILAALCTVLVVLGFFFAAPGIYPLATFIRRAIGVSILWITAVLLAERMRVENALYDHQHLISESQGIAHIGSWRYDLTGRTTWSDETYRIFGLSKDTFTPNDDLFLNLIYPEDRAAMQAWIAAFVAGEQPGKLEFRAVLPDGRVCIIKVCGDLRCDSSGRPVYIAGTAQDITEQKQAEEALQAVEDRLRGGRMGTFDWDVAHDRLTWSRGLEVLFGGPGQFSGTYETFAQRVHPEDLPGVNAEIARCMAARDSYAREYRVVWPDGSVHWMASQGEFTFSDAGQAVGMRGVVLDITERKRADAALRESEDRYRDLVENSQDLLCTHDLEGRMLSCNPAPARILGYTVEEILQRPMRDFLAPEHRDEFDEYLAQVQKDGIAEGLMLVITRTGERRIWEYRNTLRTEGVPEPIVRGMAHDITERKRAEGVQNWLASFPMLAPYSAVEVDLAGRVVFLNPAAERLFPDMESRGVAHPWLAELKGVERTCRASERGECVREVHIGGAWYDQVAFLVPSTQHLRLYGFDITDRKRAEQARDWIFEYSLDMLCVAGFDGYFKRVSPSFEKVLGWSEAELLFRPQTDFIHPDDRESSLKAAKAYEVGTEAINFVNRYRCKDGSYKWISWNAYPLVQKQIIIGVARDITDHKRAEEAFRVSEEKYRILFESNPQPMWVYHLPSLRFLAVNQSAIRHYGYTREEFLAMTLRDIRPPEDIPAMEQAALRSSSYDKRETWRHRTKDGRTIYVDIAECPVDFENQTASLVLANDVTERHFLEDELRQAQKMEAVGRLAGGVAHDFNNVLMAIQMNGSLLAGGLVPPGRQQEKARDILASADRGAALTRQLLAFGRKQVLEPRVVDLNDLLRGILSLMQGLIPENIAVTVSLCKSLGLVKVDPTQFEHVIINLVINARDAMPTGGRLSLATSNVDPSGQAEEPITRILPPGQYVMVTVSDTGIGMDASTQARIFEPYFTARKNEGGTGLGLATSYGTIKQSGGYMLVYSERGQGTTFKVHLPTVEGEPKAVATTSEPNSARGRGETILLVEDEERVRKSIAEFLSTIGYVVLEARDGPEALKLAMSSPSDIAAVVTDMVMPGIDGREVIEILRQLRPQLKAVLMSGYTAGKVVEDQETASFTFLHKPFTAEALASTLQRAISRS
jgi:two-component system, cell cycle sensor histidine kinase and response regulator CckA